MQSNGGERPLGGTVASGERASAVTIGVVFVGLFIVTALLLGSFWVVATGGDEPGDPAKLSVGSTICTVSSNGNTTGIGTVTLSLRYSGNESLNVSDATFEYEDESTQVTLSVAATASASTVAIQNSSGAFDDTIDAGTDLTVIVSVAAIRGNPLASGSRATIDMRLRSGTAASTSVRAPGGLSESESFVDC